MLCWRVERQTYFNADVTTAHVKHEKTKSIKVLLCGFMRHDPHPKSLLRLPSVRAMRIIYLRDYIFEAAYHYREASRSVSKGALSSAEHSLKTAKEWAVKARQMKNNGAVSSPKDEADFESLLELHLQIQGIGDLEPSPCNEVVLDNIVNLLNSVGIKP